MTSSAGGHPGSQSGWVSSHHRPAATTSRPLDVGAICSAKPLAGIGGPKMSDRGEPIVSLAIMARGSGRLAGHVNGHIDDGHDRHGARREAARRPSNNIRLLMLSSMMLRSAARARTTHPSVRLRNLTYATMNGAHISATCGR